MLNVPYLVRKCCDDQAVHPFAWTLQGGVGQNKIVVSCTEGDDGERTRCSDPGAAATTYLTLRAVRPTG